jgi:hypothetical protein
LVARGKLLPRRISLFLFYIYLLLAVSACSFSSKESAIKRAAPPPPATAEKDKPLTAIAAMPSPMDTFRALAPPEGMRFTPLFDAPVDDPNIRMKRLEDSVQTIRNDVDTLVPTMVRMVAIEKDIKGLVAQLQTLTDQGQSPSAAPVEAVTPQTLPPSINGGKTIPGEGAVEGTKPAEADKAKAGSDTSSSLVTPEAASKGELPPEGAASPSSTAPVDLKKPQAKPESEKANLEPKPEKKAEAEPQPTGPTIGDAKDIRIADYPDKTRVVVDMTAAPDGATARIENNGRTLVIPLPKLNWLGPKTWDAETAQLISGYHVEEGNLYVDLMYASQIKYQNVLKPGGANKDHRLVIDLFSPEVHK